MIYDNQDVIEIGNDIVKTLEMGMEEDTKKSIISYLELAKVEADKVDEYEDIYQSIVYLITNKYIKKVAMYKEIETIIEDIYEIQENVSEILAEEYLEDQEYLEREYVKSVFPENRTRKEVKYVWKKQRKNQNVRENSCKST